MNILPVSALGGSAHDRGGDFLKNQKKGATHEN